MADESQVGDRADQSLVDQLKEASQQTTTLLRQEVELAKAEIVQKLDLAKDEFEQASSQVSHELQQTKDELQEVGKKAGAGAGLFSGAGLFGLAGFAVLTAALVAGISTFLPVWASALIVTALYVAVAGGLALAGKTKLQEAKAGMPAATDGMNKVKDVVGSTKDSIRQVPVAPEMTINTLKQSKDRLASAWKRGGAQTKPPSQAPSEQAPTQRQKPTLTSNTDLNFRKK